MSQPASYDRQANFSDEEALNPTTKTPGASLDAELNAVKISIDQTQANLALIQRDDGALKNGIVTRDTLSPSLSIGFTLRGAWEAPENYLASDGVSYGAKFYRAIEANLSTNLNRPDVDSATWEEIADFAAISADAAVSAGEALASANASASSAGAASTSAGEAAASASASSGFADAASTSAGEAAASALTATTLLGGTVTEAVRHDVAQSLSAGQQLQARQNIGGTAAGSALLTAADAAAQTALLAAAVGDSGTGGTKGLVPAATAGDTAAGKIFDASGAFVAMADKHLPADTIVDRAHTETATYFTVASANGIPMDDSIPQIAEGVQILTLNHTMKSATNRLRARFTAFGGIDSVGYVSAALFNGAAGAIAAVPVTIGSAGHILPIVLEHEFVPGTTSTVTYSVRAGPGGAYAAYINGDSIGRKFGGVGKATLVLEEIKA